MLKRNPMPLRGETSLLSVLVVFVGLTACKRHEPPSDGEPTARGPAWFEDSAATLGLDFKHDSGASGTYFMPESLSSGGALLDFDNDGRLDVYLLHHVPPNSKSKNRLFHQEPDGRFRDVSAGSGLDITGYGMGVAVGDINNDSLPEVLVTEFGNARLFRNLGGGRFEDITHAAGIDCTRWATAASFFDYDRDGWLDLVVVNYVDYSPSVKCYDSRGAIEYCGPQGLAGTASRLFHNLTGRAKGQSGSQAIRFEDVSVVSGLARKTGASLGVVCADFSGDHWPDIFIADDGMANRLYINQHDGTFSEEAVPRGIAYNAFGGVAANMGVAYGDVDGDCLADVFVTHLVWEQHALWKQGPVGLFQDRTASVGLGNMSRRGTAFGTVLGDFDLNGALDLAFVAGDIKRGNRPPSTEKDPFLPGLEPFFRPYAHYNQLFSNDGSGKFQDISEANPAFCGRAAVGRGLACGDMDNDGDLDLLVANTAAPAQLLRNIAPKRGHWLMIRAVDPALGGRDAYGTEITVRAAGKSWLRLVQPAYSYLVSNDPRAHFGLGPVQEIGRVEITWPDGVKELFPGGRTDRLLVLAKGGGSEP